jgi:16S rRNA processing protein RimM
LLLEVGRIIKPHGIRGEVIVDLLSNRPERLDPGSVLASDVGDLEVVRSTPHQNRWIVAFAGVADRNRAEELRGTVLRAEAIEGEEDVLWVHELVGALVYDVNGLLYGRVREVEANPASDLLVLPQGLVPLTFVVEHEGNRVVIDPPEGLIEPRPPIEVVDYDPEWPRMYEAEAERLRLGLGELAVRIEHVGSTSVPGLAAKPIVDIQVSVPDISDLDSYRGPLEALGYEYVYDPEFLEYPFFGWPARAQPRTYNLHVCEADTDWEQRHLRFRDRLRRDEGIRDEYAALKRDLALKHGNDIQGYVDDKDAFIRVHSGEG